MLMSVFNILCGIEIVVLSFFSNFVFKVFLFNLGMSLFYKVFENDYDLRVF